MRGRGRALPYAIAACAGLALAGALPPSGSPYLALAFGPLLYLALHLAAAGSRRPGAAHASSLGALAGMVFGCVAYTFVPSAVRALIGPDWGVPAIAYVAAVTTHALPPALACLAVHRFVDRPSPLRFAASLAASFSLVPMVFPYDPAVLLLDLRPLSIWARVGGAPLCDVLAVAPLAALMPDSAWTVRRATTGLAALAAVLLGGVVLLRGLESARALAPHVTVAAVQTDVALARGRDEGARGERLFAMRRATADAVRGGASVVIFPESSYPHELGRYATREPPFPLDVGARHHDVHVLVGATTVAGGCGRWNGAVLFDAAGARVALADKQRRMPFADVRGLPFGVPACGELRPAVARAPLPLPGDPAVLVCYDEVEPAPARRAVGMGAGYLIGMTNDAWYEATRQPHLQLQHARLRAIETGRDLVRAVNRRGTGLARADGRFVQLVSGAGPQVGFARVAIARETTLATRLGVLPSLLLVLGCVLYGRRRSGGGGR